MGKKRLTINLITNLLSYGASIVIQFFLTPFLVGHLGKEVFGYYGLATDVVNYVKIISIALNSLAAKYITVELVRGHKIKAEQYFSSIFISNIALSVFLTPVLTVIVVWIRSFFKIGAAHVRDVQILFALVFLTMIVNLINSVFGCATYATNRVDLRAYTQLGWALLRIGLYVLIFKVFPASIVYVGIVALILEVYNCVMQIVWKRKLLPDLHVRRRSFDLKLVFDTLKVGMWNSLNHLGDLLLSSVDRIAANIMIDETASGDIAIVKQMPSLISGVITAINGVFMPRVATRYAENDKNALVKEVHLAQRIMGVFATPVVMMLMIFGREFFTLWVPGNDADLLMRLNILDVSRMMLIGVVWPVSNLNVMMDKIKIPSLLVIVSGAANLAGMFLLIRYTGVGIYAIPLTTLILTILFYGIFIPIYPCKELGLSRWTFFDPVWEMLISAGVIAAVVIPLKKLFVIRGWATFILYGGICGVIALGISVVVFVKPRNIGKAITKVRKKLHI